MCVVFLVCNEHVDYFFIMSVWDLYDFWYEMSVVWDEYGIFQICDECMGISITGLRMSVWDIYLSMMYDEYVEYFWHLMSVWNISGWWWMCGRCRMSVYTYLRSTSPWCHFTGCIWVRGCSVYSRKSLLYMHT